MSEYELRLITEGKTDHLLLDPLLRHHKIEGVDCKWGQNNEFGGYEYLRKSPSAILKAAGARRFGIVVEREWRT